MGDSRQEGERLTAGGYTEDDDPLRPNLSVFTTNVTGGGGDTRPITGDTGDEEVRFRQHCALPDIILTADLC